jgi:hypothetical protein
VGIKLGAVRRTVTGALPLPQLGTGTRTHDTPERRPGADTTRRDFTSQLEASEKSGRARRPVAIVASRRASVRELARLCGSEAPGARRGHRPDVRRGPASTATILWADACHVRLPGMYLLLLLLIASATLSLSCLNEMRACTKQCNAV